MRASHLAGYLFMCMFGCGVIACADSGQSPSSIDAPPPLGTPSAPPSTPPPNTGIVCAQQGTLNGTTVLDFSALGQVPGRVSANDTELSVAVLVTTDAARTKGFIIAQRNNTGVFSTANGKAGRFERPPATGVYAMDTDASIGFGIDFVDGVTTNPDGSLSVHPTQVALLDPAAGGSVRIDSWAPAATPGGTSTISATFTNARFRGYNILPNGNPDPAGNGCDILVQNLQFKKWQTTLFPASFTALPPRDLAPWTRNLAAALGAEITLDP